MCFEVCALCRGAAMLLLLCVPCRIESLGRAVLRGAMVALRGAQLTQTLFAKDEAFNAVTRHPVEPVLVLIVIC